MTFCKYISALIITSYKEKTKRKYSCLFEGDCQNIKLSVYLQNMD